MYQSDLAKDLKKHKKIFPLNLNFTTDLNTPTEFFASERLFVLLHVSWTVELSDSWPLSLLTLKLYCIIQSMLLDMIIPFKWIISFWVRDILLILFFQNTFIFKTVTMPAVTIQLYEQRLNFFSACSYHWHQVFLIDQHSFHLIVNNSVVFLGTTSPYFQSTWFRQSDLTFGFMCGCVIQTWSISTVHLLDHSGWFRHGHVIQVGPVILNPRSFTELWKKRSWETTYWGCLAL